MMNIVTIPMYDLDRLRKVPVRIDVDLTSPKLISNHARASYVSAVGLGNGERGHDFSTILASSREIDLGLKDLHMNYFFGRSVYPCTKRIQ